MMIVITHQFVCVKMKLFEMIIFGSIKNVWPTISLDLHNVYRSIYLFCDMWSLGKLNFCIVAMN